MTTSLVQHAREGVISVITLDRPDKRNAMTPAMLDQLVASVRGSADAHCVLLRGQGAVFCGGFDLKLCLEQEGTLEALLRGLHDVVRALRDLNVPVVAAAHGAAIAGGCALLGGCDVVVTNVQAKLGYPVVPLGISPAISAPFLRHLVGDGPARERLLDPALIDGRAAARIGLASECVRAADEVLPRAMRIAESLAAKPRGAVVATRGLLRDIEDRSSATDTEAGLLASLSLVGSPEERNRLTALFAPKPS